MECKVRLMLPKENLYSPQVLKAFVISIIMEHFRISVTTFQIKKKKANTMTSYINTYVEEPIWVMEYGGGVVGHKGVLWWDCINESNENLTEKMIGMDKDPSIGFCTPLMLTRNNQSSPKANSEKWRTIQIHWK